MSSAVRKTVSASSVSPGDFLFERAKCLHSLRLALRPLALLLCLIHYVAQDEQVFFRGPEPGLGTGRKIASMRCSLQLFAMFLKCSRTPELRDNPLTLLGEDATREARKGLAAPKGEWLMGYASLLLFRFRGKDPLALRRPREILDRLSQFPDSDIGARFFATAPPPPSSR
jgi:hypothetical protein